MVSNIATVCLVCLLNLLGQGSADESLQRTACLTKEECLERKQLLSIIGVTNLFVGNYGSFGCYYQGDTAYFGLGGSTKSMSEENLPGDKHRIWCESSPISVTAPTNRTTKEPSKVPLPSPSSKPTDRPIPQPTREPSDARSPIPTPKPSASPTEMPTIPVDSTNIAQKACRNKKKCDLMRQELGYDRYYIGNYPIKGCFSKSGIAYFGVGGNLQQKSTFLSGGKERIWCGSNVSSNGSNDGSTLTTKSPITTKSATKSPVSSPIAEEYCIDIEVITDKFGVETGFSLSTNPEDGSEPESLIEYAIGSLESETTYAERVCVPEGKYTFSIEDTFNGICCTFGKGSYAVRLDGDEIIYGGNFKDKKLSRDILAGFDPVMTDDDNMWLDAHNARRKAFHEEHDTEFRPLKWSPELANGASKWVDEIFANDCDYVREPYLDAGENMAVRRSNSPQDNEGQDDILTRWSDHVLDKDPPEKQTMTQVMWRASRYLGCANDILRNPDGSYCYISICRYSRPGNCAMGSYSTWLEPTLKDRTACGKICPDEGCS